MSCWLRPLRSGVPIAAVLIFPLAIVSTQPLEAGPPQSQRRTRPAPAKSAPASKPSSTDTDPARLALEAGHYEEAMVQADLVLAKAPANQAAVNVKIQALVARDRLSDAFTAYDVYRKASGPASATLLAPIARRELRALSNGDLTSMRAEALGALAADDNRVARRELEQFAASTTNSSAALSSNEALARLGDAKAAERLVAFAAQLDPGRRTILLGEIATIPNAPALALVRESLKSTDPMAQATAAEVAAALGFKELQPELKQVMATGHPFAQNGAAVALMRLGDTASQERVKTLLTSPAATVRLQAARAFSARGDRSWVKDVQPLLQDPEGLTRFLAAEVLLPIDRQPSLEVLRAGLVDQNPTIRAEAARILTADAHPDLDLLRLMLADETPRVRLLASRAVLQEVRKHAASAPASKKPR